MQNQQDASGYVVISWVALLVGWFLGLSIVAFPIGIWAANRGREAGRDTSLIRLLNVVSLVLVVIGMIFFFFVGLLFM